MVPIIVERYHKSNLKALINKKILIEDNLLIRDLLVVIKKRIELKAQDALFIYV